MRSRPCCRTRWASPRSAPASPAIPRCGEIARHHLRAPIHAEGRPQRQPARGRGLRARRRGREPADLDGAARAAPRPAGLEGHLRRRSAAERRRRIDLLAAHLSRPARPSPQVQLAARAQPAPGRRQLRLQRQLSQRTVAEHARLPLAAQPRLAGERRQIGAAQLGHHALEPGVPPARSVPAAESAARPGSVLSASRWSARSVVASGAMVRAPSKCSPPRAWLSQAARPSSFSAEDLDGALGLLLRVIGLGQRRQVEAAVRETARVHRQTAGANQRELDVLGQQAEDLELHLQLGGAHRHLAVGVVNHHVVEDRWRGQLAAEAADLDRARQPLLQLPAHELRQPLLAEARSAPPAAAPPGAAGSRPPPMPSARRIIRTPHPTEMW